MKALNRYRRHWILLSCAVLVFAQPVLSEELAAERSAADQVYVEDVPEVAITRLRALLKANPPDDEWRKVAIKLAEALIAAQRPGEALILLEDPRSGQAPLMKFWRAQALARRRPNSPL